MGQLVDITVRTQIITMKTSTVFAVALVCMSCLTVSQAFSFGNDGLMSMMFMMNMLGHQAALCNSLMTSHGPRKPMTSHDLQNKLINSRFGYPPYIAHEVQLVLLIM